jgi:hypothetical protein
MKRRVFNRFVDYVNCELPIPEGTWPTIEEIETVIKASAHYQALVDVGLPADHEKTTGRKTPEAEVKWSVIQTMRRIEQRWIEKKIHDCLGMKELETCILKEIGEFKMGYSDAMTFIREYYTRLTASISNTLYYSKPVFNREQLEMMVPDVESSFFNRQKIIERYLKEIKGTKPDGHRKAITVLQGEDKDVRTTIG